MANTPSPPQKRDIIRLGGVIGMVLIFVLFTLKAVGVIDVQLASLKWFGYFVLALLLGKEGLQMLLERAVG